jgi:hypothetical protein
MPAECQVARLPGTRVALLAGMTSNGVQADALTQLRSEHAHLASLLGELAREPDPGRAHGLFRTVYEELNAHSAAEHAVFYAALAGSATAAELVQRAMVAHATIAALAEELLAGSPAEPPWREMMRALQRAIAEHVDEEERELFTIARREVGGDALRTLGTRLREAAARWREAECGGGHLGDGVGALAMARG